MTIAKDAAREAPYGPSFGVIGVFRASVILQAVGYGVQCVRDIWLQELQGHDEHDQEYRRRGESEQCPQATKAIGRYTREPFVILCLREIDQVDHQARQPEEKIENERDHRRGNVTAT